tara:strand:- start:15138 stop:15716 length:579 start_codon:yes stop_codon:yes gene_type:complete
VQVNSVNNKPLNNIVVYLEPLMNQSLPQRKESISVTQNNKAFAPYITVSQSSSKVNFVNKDDITHHIYSANSENKFSFIIRSGEKNATKQFNHSAEIAMGCNIHDWMSGYLVVVDTPYFAKTDQQGIASFSVDELGKYRIVIWHPQMQEKNNRMMIDKNLSEDRSIIAVTLQKEMNEIPQQISPDFDFISDY